MVRRVWRPSRARLADDPTSTKGRRASGLDTDMPSESSIDDRTADQCGGAAVLASLLQHGIPATHALINGAVPVHVHPLVVPSIVTVPTTSPTAPTIVPSVALTPVETPGRA